MKYFALALSLGLAWASPSSASEPETNSPEANLPDNIEQLTWFGERPSWSPDGKRIAFMAKTFGDAFEIDLETRRLTLLTHYPHPGYLRVQFLPNGDYLLIGSRNFEDTYNTRYRTQELWLLRPGSGKPAAALEQKMTEGVAISRSAMKIAYAVDSRTHPEEIPDGEAAIFTADVMYGEDGTPQLTNRKAAVRVRRPDCVGTEPQDFRYDDTELTFVCYTLLPGAKAGSWQGNIGAVVPGVNLNTGQVTSYRERQDEYNEVEGIYPDGRYTLVESSRDQPTNSSQTIDIWKLRLEPGSSDMTRLTRWGDTPGRKSSNPVVNPDGNMIAFQSGRSSDDAGVGYGIFLLRE
ncbi:MAG: hypothetical protein AB7F98_16560 [Novosphingobium sp.]